MALAFVFEMSYIDTMKKKPNTLLARIKTRISRKHADVILRSDFKDLGDYDQVGRCLLTLIREGTLVKIGQGIYVRAVISPLDNRPALPKSLNTLAQEALKRLDIPTAPTSMERSYNEGRTTQVPAGRVIGVRKRVRRLIGFNGYSLRFERTS
ncbi:DUF6088 family protein [Chlorobium ferrooxidans]|uniref:DUF6088 family protein n=1 Tax=Chlorobium ferrooxidans TaxID=84205 RepID=UPI001E4C2F9D|nr:DUF6088 family protein [Chlorobium ferrooxidans]